MGHRHTNNVLPRQESSTLFEHVRCLLKLATDLDNAAYNIRQEAYELQQANNSAHDEMSNAQWRNRKPSEDQTNPSFESNYSACPVTEGLEFTSSHQHGSLDTSELQSSFGHAIAGLLALKAGDSNISNSPKTTASVAHGPSTCCIQDSPVAAQLEVVADIAKKDISNPSLTLTETGSGSIKFYVRQAQTHDGDRLGSVETVTTRSGFVAFSPTHPHSSTSVD